MLNKHRLFLFPTYLDRRKRKQVERPITMKKDGIQTRNRKLAAKAKKRRMHDFFKPLDPRFGGYGGMGLGVSSLASCYGPSVATNPMSQYYAANTMGAQMSQYMSPSSMAHMAAATVGAAADPTHQQRYDALSQQDHLGLHQSLGGGHHHSQHQQQQDSPTSSASAMMTSNSPTSHDVMGSSAYNNSAAAAAAAAAAMTASAYSWSAKDAVSAAAALSSSNESQQPSSSSPASSSVVTPTSMVGASA